MRDSGDGDHGSMAAAAFAFITVYAFVLGFLAEWLINWGH